MNQRFKNALKAGINTNGINKKYNCKYLVKNHKTGRIYQVQNRDELKDLLSFIAPDLKNRNIKVATTIRHWEIVIEDVILSRFVYDTQSNTHYDVATSITKRDPKLILELI